MLAAQNTIPQMFGEISRDVTTARQLFFPTDATDSTDCTDVNVAT